MEQLTWPRGSGGHIFSTISASDYGEHDLQQRRPDSAQRRHGWNEAFEPPLHKNSSRSSDIHLHHHHLHRHHSLQIDPGYGVDHQPTGRAHNSLNFPTSKQDHEEQAFDSGVEQATGKAQNSCRKEKQQESSGSYAEVGADISKTKFSMYSALYTPLQYESQANRIPHPHLNIGGHCSSTNLCHTDRRNHSYLIVSNLNKVYHLRHSYDTLPATNSSPNFAMLPDDILLRIMGSFSWPNLWSASRVCRSWCQALAPLREAMHFVHWGKRFKHGRGGIARNLDKALHSFLNGAKRGCAAAMVDAGLLMWEMGQKQEGVFWYKQAAELGDPAGQCNLGLAYLQDSSNPAEAVKWFHRAALAGHVRAQYSLALCLQQGKGVDCSVAKAARWYQRAAEGGSARAMYNLALCYRKGEGLIGDSHEARRWMKRAALAGHRKAQFEHGLTLFAENDGGLALVFLELATRAGETAATHLRDALIQQLSPKMRTHAITCADKWQAKLNART